MRRSTLVGVLLLTIAAIALPWPASAETRIALVIGNSAYPSGPLGSPKDDAKAIEAKLKVLGFQVTRKTDLRREEFFNAIRDFGDRLQQPGTVGLFYYSGHAMQVNNRNYMIPTDADIHSEVDVGRYAVPVEDVLVRIDLGKSNPNFVIFDACRNNPFEKRFKSSEDGLAQMDAPASTLMAFAAAPGRVAEAGSGGKLSLYTEALAEHIDRPFPNFISMFQAVQTAVYERSGRKQSPRLELSPGLPDFSFKPLVAGIPPPAPVPLPAPSTAQPAVGVYPPAYKAFEDFNVNILTGGTSGVYYSLGNALAAIYGTAIPGAKVTVQATQGSIQNLNLLQAGRGEVAFALAGSVGFDSKLDKLRTIASIYPNYIQVVATKDSGVETLADLKGKRVSVGAPKSGTDVNARRVFQAAGLSYNMMSVQYLPFDESVALMKEGELDATLQSTGLGVAPISELATSVPITIVPVPPEIVAKIGDPAYLSKPIPAATYRGQNRQVMTAAINNLLMTREDVPADVVYAMTKAMFDNLAKLTAAHAAAKGLSLEHAAQGSPVPLHPGAERYYKQTGVLK